MVLFLKLRAFRNQRLYPVITEACPPPAPKGIEGIATFTCLEAMAFRF